MAAIGIDTHKATLAACCVDELGTPVSERTFDNDPAGHRALLDWAAQVGHDTVIGIEGSASFGAPLRPVPRRGRVDRPRGPAAALPARTDPDAPSRQERLG